MSDTEAATETEVADTPTTEVQPEPESAEQAPDPADDTDAAEPTADDAQEFSRSYVEKLRRESAGYRERATTAEAAVEALQRQQVERLADDAGIKPAAIWAVAELGALLGEDGSVDAELVNAAIGTARSTLGVTGRPQPPRSRNMFASGSGVPQETPKGFAEAFAPRER
ncbi:hypothetical protein [Mycolicibacter kumamotonensis]|uniref:DUF4355 domain-containing protein n=1 Tax=Mycolicibacter kumamotonensis TaxID=354243 RepID=A0A7K3LDY5_9MYCO|nr:hypothetical protein [Mycolicibacter kumamotonensis]NDJ90584.1 hypothetical protein [Mycolicibacter kumamotonensis]